MNEGTVDLFLILNCVSRIKRAEGERFERRKERIINDQMRRKERVEEKVAFSSCESKIFLHPFLFSNFDTLKTKSLIEE